MNALGFYLPSKTIYGFFAISLSFLIVVNYSLSLYYGIRMIILKTQNRYGWCPEMLITVESFAWFVLFGYIFIRIILYSDPIGLDAFGDIYIRPLIFISSCITSILQRRRYLLYKKRLRIKKETKGG